MGLGCSGSCMKYLLFFFNFIFFLTGAAILGVGIWAQVDPTVSNYIGITIDDSSSYDAAIILLICVGAFIFLVGFLGCCGACKESPCMLSTFAALLIILVLVQIVAAILVAVFQSDVKKGLKDFMTKQVNETYGDDNGLTNSWDELQEHLACCGASGPEDWRESYWRTNKPHPEDNVPSACCKGQTDPCEVSNAYSEGCYDKLLSWIDDHAIIIMGIGFGLAFVEIAGIVMACCVKKRLDSGDYYS